MLCSNNRDQRVNQIWFSCYSCVIKMYFNHTKFPWPKEPRPAICFLFQVGVNLHFLITWVIWGPCSFILCFVNKGTCRNLWTGCQILGGVSPSLWLPWLMFSYGRKPRLISVSGCMGVFPKQHSWDHRLYSIGSVHRWERMPVHSSAGLQPGVLPSSLFFLA